MIKSNIIHNFLKSNSIGGYNTRGDYTPPVIFISDALLLENGNFLKAENGKHIALENKGISAKDVSEPDNLN